MTVSRAEHTASPYGFTAVQRYTSVSSPVSLLICGDAKGRGVGPALPPPLSLDAALGEGRRGRASGPESWRRPSGETAPDAPEAEGTVFQARVGPSVLPVVHFLLCDLRQAP